MQPKEGGRKRGVVVGWVTNLCDPLLGDVFGSNLAMKDDNVRPKVFIHVLPTTSRECLSFIDSQTLSGKGGKNMNGNLRI